MKTLFASLVLLLLSSAARAEPPLPWGQTMNASDWYRVQFSGDKCYYPKAAFDAAAEGATLSMYELTFAKRVGLVTVWTSAPCLLTRITKMGGKFNNPAGAGGMEMAAGVPAVGGLMLAVAPGADLTRVYKSLAYLAKSPQ